MRILLFVIVLAVVSLTVYAIMKLASQDRAALKIIYLIAGVVTTVIILMFVTVIV